MSRDLDVITLRFTKEAMNGLLRLLNDGTVHNGIVHEFSVELDDNLEGHMVDTAWTPDEWEKRLRQESLA